MLARSLSAPLQARLHALLTVAAVLVFLLAPLAGAPRAAEPQEIPITEAMHHVGETVTVCGRVASAAYLASVTGRPTFLNMGKAYPDQLFTVVIWGQSRVRFDKPPEQLYDGMSICVTGKVETYKGRPQIEVKNPDQIVLSGPVSERGELAHLETIFVKAVLASLGYEANYGSSEWGEDTAEAVVSFQEAHGLATTGDADSATLRALASSVAEIPDADRTMIIRLLLFELARRGE